MTTEDLLAMKDKVKALLEEAKQLNSLIKSTCHHPADKLEAKTYYFNGSYNDMAYTQYWNECSICQERSAIKQKDHNYYG